MFINIIESGIINDTNPKQINIIQDEKNNPYIYLLFGLLRFGSL
jgi:hypothetical protein